jgi:hypothetical protein
MASKTLSGLGLGAASALLIGCGSGDTQHLDPAAIAMTEKTTAFYDDGELQLFQVETPVDLPIARPAQSDSAKLNGAVGPFAHHPWVTTSDVKVQVTWTLANLDDDTHTVEVLVDPWNEFGRYVPGIVIEGENAEPNLSGIDEIYELPGLKDARPSRIQHTFTFDDMDEMATDFATAINIIKNVKPPAQMAGDTQPPDDPRVGLVNHVFNLQNHSGHSPLTDQYIPPVIPALVGYDLGFRTTKAANIAIEYSVEIVDKDGNKVVEAGSGTAKLRAPDQVYTVGTE